MHSNPRITSVGPSLLPLARVSLYLGMFMVSLLVMRAGGSITIGDVFLIVSFVLTAVDAIGSGRRVELSWPVMVAFFLILLGGIFSTFGAVDPVGSLLVLARVVFLAFLVPWTMAVLLTSPRRVKRALIFLAAGAATCGAGSIAQLFLGNVISGSEITSGGRFPGFAVHVSDTGGIVSLAVVYGAGLLLEHGRASKILGFMIFFVGFSGLILSGSVSGMLAAAAGGLALLIWHKVRPIKLALIIGSVCAAGTWALSAMESAENALTPMERLLQVTGATAETRGANTSSTRWDSIVAGWQGFLSRPLAGVGLEPSASFTLWDLPAHNFLVAALFQGGVLFTLGLGIVTFQVLRRILKRSLPHEVVIIVAAGAVSAFVFAMTAPSFYNRYFWLPIALVLVMTMLAPKDTKVLGARDIVLVGSKRINPGRWPSTPESQNVQR